jgi:hypothetical protein
MLTGQGERQPNEDRNAGLASVVAHRGHACGDLLWLLRRGTGATLASIPHGRTFALEPDTP